MADSDKKKGGMVLVISVGGKPPKKPEDTADPEVKKAIPEAGMMSDDEISARHRAQMSDWDHGDAHSATHGAYGVGDPTAPFGEPMQGGEPLIEPTANVAINPDQNVNPKLDDWDNRREQRHREIPNYRDPKPWYPDDVLDDYGDEEKLIEALHSSSPEVPPSEHTMDGPMDLGENLGEEPEEEDRPSLLESMQERYDPRGGSWLSPSGIQRLASGQPPKDIFRNSEDPFRFAWQLLKNTPTQEDDVGLTPEFMQELLEAVQGNVWADIAPPEEGANIPSTEDENDPLTAPTNPRPNSPTPVGQEEMVREGGDDLDARLAQIAAELARRDEDKPGVTPRSAGDNPMFRHLRPELEQMQADTEAEIGRRDENREARRAVRRGV